MAVDADSKRRLRLFRRPGADHTEAVRDAVDVRVHRDRGDPVAEDEHAIRGLRSDAREREQLFQRAGDLSAPSFEKDPSTLTDDLRLGVVEAGEADQPLDRS